MLLFALIAAPVFFFLLTWVAATVYRLYFPDKPVPLRGGPLLRRREAAERAMPVGVREIREAQRRHLHKQVGAYHYAGPGSDGLPTDWVEDLWRRRN